MLVVYVSVLSRDKDLHTSHIHCRRTISVQSGEGRRGGTGLGLLGTQTDIRMITIHACRTRTPLRGLFLVEQVFPVAADPGPMRVQALTFFLLVIASSASARSLLDSKDDKKRGQYRVSSSTGCALQSTHACSIDFAPKNKQFEVLCALAAVRPSCPPKDNGYAYALMGIASLCTGAIVAFPMNSHFSCTALD